MSVLQAVLSITCSGYLVPFLTHILPNLGSVYSASYSHLYFEPDFCSIWFYEGHTAGFCALCAIQNHVRSALQSTGKILSPSHLVKNLRCILQILRLFFLFVSLKWKMTYISFIFICIHYGCILEVKGYFNLSTVQMTHTHFNLSGGPY